MAWPVAAAASASLCFAALEACSEGAPASPGLAVDTSPGADASYVCPGLEAGYPPCPSPPPSYEGQVKAIVHGYCGPCHLPGGDGIAKGGNYDYSTLAGFRGLTTILTDVHGCSMPPPGSPPLPLADWDALLEWLGCGAPDN